MYSWSLIMLLAATELEEHKGRSGCQGLLAKVSEDPDDGKKINHDIHGGNFDDTDKK